METEQTGRQCHGEVFSVSPDVGNCSRPTKRYRIDFESGDNALYNRKIAYLVVSEVSVGSVEPKLFSPIAKFPLAIFGLFCCLGKRIFHTINNNNNLHRFLD